MHLRRTIKRTALGSPGFEAQCRRLSARHVKVLLYHRFAATPDAAGIPVADLARQLELIVRDHHVISTEEHVRRLVAGDDFTRSTVVVTVDDGYRDFAHVGFPVFERYRIPVTVFVATDFVEGRWLWWDRLRYALSHTAEARLVVSAHGERFDLPLTTNAERAAAWNTVADRCRFVGNEVRLALLEEVERATGVSFPQSPPREYAAMSWDEIRHLSSLGVSFAPHTASHPILARVDRDTVLREVAESRRALREKAGVDSQILAYPQGGPADFNDGVIEQARAAGIEGAYVAYQGGDSPHVNRFRLPRYQPSEDMLTFRWELCGASYLWRRARAAFGGCPDELFEGYWAGSEQEAQR